MTRNLVERKIGLSGVDSLVRLIDYEQVPLEQSDVLEFVVVATEVARTFEILERKEFDHPQILIKMVLRVIAPLLPGHRVPFGQRR